jgi:dTDP-4-amino-4,6-dideoxygalactose transaminase
MYSSVRPTIKLSRMPAVSAVIARMQLKKLDAINRKRRRNADELSKLLSNLTDYVQLPKISDNAVSTFTRYTVRLLRKRLALAANMAKSGIDTETPYNYLPGLFKALQVEAPNARELATSTLTLPNHPLVESADLIRIANTLSGELRSSA